MPSAWSAVAPARPWKSASVSSCSSQRRRPGAVERLLGQREGLRRAGGQSHRERVGLGREIRRRGRPGRRARTAPRPPPTAARSRSASSAAFAAPTSRGRSHVAPVSGISPTRPKASRNDAPSRRRSGCRRRRRATRPAPAGDPVDRPDDRLVAAGASRGAAGCSGRGSRRRGAARRARAAPADPGRRRTRGRPRSGRRPGRRRSPADRLERRPSSSSLSGTVRALSASGRSRVTVATPSAISTRRSGRIGPGGRWRRRCQAGVGRPPPRRAGRRPARTRAGRPARPHRRMPRRRSPRTAPRTRRRPGRSAPATSRCRSGQADQDPAGAAELGGEPVEHVGQQDPRGIPAIAGVARDQPSLAGDLVGPGRGRRPGREVPHRGLLDGGRRHAPREEVVAVDDHVEAAGMEA